MLTPLDCRDVESLREAFRSGARIKYVFFWSDRAPHDGSVSAACFSQWFVAPFEVDGLAYRTAEHYLMGEKARLFGDDEARQRILAAGEPGAAKRIGREVRDFDEVVWVEQRFRIAVDGNVAKFGQNPALGRFLVSTAKRVLVEASPVDTIWGIGLESKDPAATDPQKWRGENVLGFALMEARSRLLDAGLEP